MSFPKPPSIPSPIPSPVEVERDVAPVDRDGELNVDEQSFILDAELSKKRRNDPITLAFIESFVRCKNLAQASFDAGIDKTVGYRIRHYSDVSNAISKLIDKSAIKYGFDASEIMERTKEIVDFDPIAVQNADGTFKKNFFDIAPEARRNIKKLKVKNLWSEQEDMNGMKKKIIIGEVIEYEFYDKLKAVELSGKEKDMFKNTTKVVHDVTDNMADILLSSASRGREMSIAYNNKPAIEAEYTESSTDEE